MARKPLAIDLRAVEEASLVCDSEEEIAEYLGVSYSTLRRRKASFEQFEQAIKKGRTKANVFVAGKLMEQINQGNTAAIIFYLKTRCGWSEKRRLELLAQEDEKRREAETKQKLRTGMSGVYQAIWEDALEWDKAGRPNW